jgi:hypothetical protein
LAFEPCEIDKVILRLVLLLFVIVLSPGCQTTKSKSSEADIESLKSVTESLSGTPLSDESFQELKKQIKNDPEAQTAVESITGAVGGKQAAVKYCPLTGRRYAAKLSACPIHNIELEFVEE